MFTTGKRRSLKGLINVVEITKGMISDQVHNSVAEILFLKRVFTDASTVRGYLQLFWLPTFYSIALTI